MMRVSLENICLRELIIRIDCKEYMYGKNAVSCYSSLSDSHQLTNKSR